VSDVTETLIREQLLVRRDRLESAIASKPEPDLVQLLDEVDAALERMDSGSYGICEVCHEPVEEERLIADPLVRYCLDHLSPEEQTALENDLQLAAQIQRGLLPKQSLSSIAWEAAYHYQPKGPVSGDYCDLIVSEPPLPSLFFLIGDASGKGVAASMLMAHLHAIFRTLVLSGLPVEELVERAGRIFCESTLSPYFATLICGRATGSGRVEFCNAGHCTPFLLQDGKVHSMDSHSGLPLGMFSGGNYSVQTVELRPGDSIFLYTDGLSEARSRDDEEYGTDRMRRALLQCHGLSARNAIDTALKDWKAFLSGTPAGDDVTIMALRHTG
jgi:sigma-B regulation protein RsbU (phosphoserine phosphatase)